MAPRPLSGMLHVLVLAAAMPVMAAPVAGLAPQERPAAAPRLFATEHDVAWWRQAARGLPRPLPPSLTWLRDQGAWYTPFNLPGMTGPYDVRRWHRDAPRGKDAGLR
ncbi:MAG: hypothetical protein EG825_04305 [Rhodocyclaceae bacterium]|nr:hypothetical protein [Rhodocyclaceae bacterium]